MSNDQFNYPEDLFSRHTLVRAEVLNPIIRAIAEGFDLGYSAAQIDARATELEDYADAAVNAAQGGQQAIMATLAEADAGTSIIALMSPQRTLRAIGASVKVTAKSSGFTVAETDGGKLFNCTSTWTMALTAAATMGDGRVFYVKNSGAGVITIDPNSSELIDGRTTIAVYPGESFAVVCNGTAFVTVGRVRGGWIGLPTTTISGTPSTLSFTTSFDDSELDAWELSYRVTPTALLDINLLYNTGSVASPSWSNASFYRLSHAGSTSVTGGSGDVAMTGNSETANLNGKIELLRPGGAGASLMLARLRHGTGSHHFLTQNGIATANGLRLATTTSTFASGFVGLRAHRMEA